MNIDDYIKKEFNINGRIINLIHQITTFDLKRLIIGYHCNHSGTLQKRKDKLPDKDKGAPRIEG